MATTTETTQLTAGQIRADSIHDSQIASRVPKRSGGMATADRSVASLSGERAAGRLRPVSPAIHETVIPDRQQTKSPDLMRKPSPAEFSTAMAHFYRGEVQRSNTWRTRLDNTTYWAVLTVGGALSFAFSSPNNPHFLDSSIDFFGDGSATLSLLRNLGQPRARDGNRLPGADAGAGQRTARSGVGFASRLRFVNSTLYNQRVGSCR